MAIESLTVEVLAPTINAAVLRLPSRKYPGVLVQGDTLSILAASARRARDGDPDEAAELVLALEGLLTAYEAAMVAHGLDLPYAKRVTAADR